MEADTTLLWELGPKLSRVPWQRGECLQSPKLKTKDGVSWWLDFYPAGDKDDDTDGLVFWLNRSAVENEVKATFEIQLCFGTIPARQYTLQYVFEKGEDCHKWMVVDIKNLAQMKIFIPPSSLCIRGFLRVLEKEDPVDVPSDVTVVQNRIVANV